MAGIVILAASIVVSGAHYMGARSFEWTPSNPSFIYSLVLTLGFFISIGAGFFGAIKEMNEFLIAAGTSCIVLAILNKLFANLLYSWSYLDTMWVLAGAMMILDSFQVRRVKEARRLEELTAEEQKPDSLIATLDKLEAEGQKAQPDLAPKYEKEIQEIKRLLYSGAKERPELIKKLRIRLYHSPVVQEIMKRFVEENLAVLEPTIETSETPTYPALTSLRALNPRQVNSTLNDLVESGILRKELYEKLNACPRCHRTAHVFNRIKCPKCDTYRVDINRLMQHIDCGAIYKHQEYDGLGGPVCPKCGKSIDKELELKNVGVVFECESCKGIFNDPNRSFYCRSCNNEFQLKDTELVDTHSYRLSEDAKSEAKETLTVLAVADKIQGLGFTVTAPGSMKGRSGVDHEFTLVCGRKDKLIAVDFAAAEGMVGTKTVLSSYAKFTDVVTATKLLVAMPALEQQARDFLNTNRIPFLETEDPTIISNKISQLAAAS